MMTGETLLHSIDCAIDDAFADGRIGRHTYGAEVRELSRALMHMGAPLCILPRLKQPPLTATLVMSRDSLRELRRACRMYGELPGSGAMEYNGVPIKVDDDAGDAVRLVSLCQMRRPVDG